MTEKVLAVPAKTVLKSGYFAKGPLIKGWFDASMCFDDALHGGLAYIDRDQAERDPNWLQLIPYCVLLRGHEVFLYRRTKKVGESRLAGKCSLGLGGHINPIDGEDLASPHNAYYAGLRRELCEEVVLTGQSWESVVKRLSGVIFDPANEVGQVHLGLVHLMRLDRNSQVKLNDPALEGGCFVSITSLRESAAEMNLEGWSQLVLQELL